MDNYDFSTAATIKIPLEKHSELMNTERAERDRTRPDHISVCCDCGCEYELWSKYHARCNPCYAYNKL